MLVFDQVRVHYILLWQQEVSDFLFCERDMDFVVCEQVLVEGDRDSWHVRLYHLANAREDRLVGKAMHLDETGHRSVCWFEGEPTLNELFRI